MTNPCFPLGWASLTQLFHCVLLSPLGVTLFISVIARSLGFRVSFKKVIGYRRIQITINSRSQKLPLTQALADCDVCLIQILRVHMYSSLQRPFLCISEVPYFRGRVIQFRTLFLTINNQNYKVIHGNTWRGWPLAPNWPVSIFSVHSDTQTSLIALLLWYVVHQHS